MSLYTVTTGGQISAGDVNQLVNILQQPAGGQEKGAYFLAGAVYANGAVVSMYICYRSRDASPVSVTIDELAQIHTGGMNATPTVGQLTAGGFQLYSLNTSGPNVNARAGGNYTTQF